MDPKSPLVRIREDGTIEPLTRRSEMFLKGKPGLLHLVASSPDVFVLRRVGSEDDAGARVLLAGEIAKKGSVGDVLGVIIQAGWTGELVVTEGLTRRSLFVREATIIGAASNALTERIGAVMTRLGVIDPDQLKVVVTRLSSGKRFGEVAIEAGFLTREKLFEVVRRQADDIAAGAVAVADGAFAFVEGIDEAKIPARCHLDAREVVAAALERLVPASVPAADSVEEPIGWFNAAFGAIVLAAKKAGKLGPVRASLDAFAEESAIDRAVFARMSPEGALDPQLTAEVLAALGVTDPRATLGKRLYEFLVYALFVSTSELPKDVERALLAHVETPMAALTPRPPPVAVTEALARHSTPPVARPALVRASTAPIARVALKRMPTHPSLAHAVVDASVAAPEPPPARKPEPVVEPLTPAPEPEAEPPAVVPARDPRRIGTALVLASALVIASGVAFSVLQLPVGQRWMAKVRPPRTPTSVNAIPPPVRTVTPPGSVVVFTSAAVPASAAPVPSETASAAPSVAKPASTVGSIRANDSGGHRVWIDGKLVGDTPHVFEVTCGHHVVRIGSSGQPQMLDVPCGGEVLVGFR